MILSYSQIQLYLKCPRQYFYAYIEKIPQPLHKSLSFGISIHSALYSFLRAYKEAKDTKETSLFSEDHILPDLSYLLECLDRAWVSMGYEDSSTMYEKKEYGIKLLREWYKKEVQELHIEFLEKSFLLHIGKHSVKGRYDRIDRTGAQSFEIIDYKTGKLRTEEECNNDLQLMLYALALSSSYPNYDIRLSLHFLEHEKKVPVEFDTFALIKAQETVSIVGNSIEAGIFEATPGEHLCSYCSYNKLCPQAL